MQGHLNANGRVLRASIVSSVLLLVLLPLWLSGCGTLAVVASASAANTHPVVQEGQTCTSCKAPNHNYKHVAPYQGLCANCHEMDSWTQVQYTHRDKNMDTGLHDMIACERCHAAAQPLPSRACNTCHAPSTHPVTAGCNNCHTPMAWYIPPVQPSKHDPLVGGHSELTCFKCHQGSTAFTKPKSCVGCHGVHHGGLTACASCHSPGTSWKLKPGFNHSRYFVLKGKHKTVQCKKCHPKNAFALARPQCSHCHGPHHGGLTECYRCHTTSSFVPSTFSHSTVFVLRGAHVSLACSKCHPRSAYARVIGRGSCVSCHHRQHGGLTACASCHNTASFAKSSFRHQRVWRLTGKHASVRCTKCHPRAAYARAIGSPKHCVNCHKVHHGNQTQCQSCHTTSAFSPAKKISHPVSPSLGGEHASRPCSLCHPGLRFDKSPMDCSSCHTAPHVAPTDCLRCHRPTTWSDIHFTHSDIGYHTQYPIDKACPYCHTTGNYSEYRCDQCHYPY